MKKEWAKPEMITLDVNATAEGSNEVTEIDGKYIGEDGKLRATFFAQSGDESYVR